MQNKRVSSSQSRLCVHVNMLPFHAALRSLGSVICDQPWCHVQPHTCSNWTHSVSCVQSGCGAEQLNVKSITRDRSLIASRSLLHPLLPRWGRPAEVEAEDETGHWVDVSEVQGQWLQFGSRDCCIYSLTGSFLQCLHVCVFLIVLFFFTSCNNLKVSFPCLFFLPGAVLSPTLNYCCGFRAGEEGWKLGLCKPTPQELTAPGWQTTLRP